MTKEVWVSPRADGFAGAGTPSDPFNGAGDAFEHLCRTFEEGMTIHLGPGIYLTRNGWALKPLTRVIGAGMWNTTIKQVPGRLDGAEVICGDIRTDGFNAISDLTVDASFPEMTLASHESMQGIFLWGSHNSVERVRVLNFGGTWDKQMESFGIAITGACTGATIRDVVAATIRDCYVEGSGSYDNGIIISPGIDDSGIKSVRGALIEGCTARDIYPRNGTGHGSAFGMYSGVLRDCTAIDCQRGFYSEGIDCLTITGNQFLGCKQYGLLVAVGECSSLTVAQNVIDGSATFPPGPGQIIRDNRTPTGAPIPSLPDNPVALPVNIPKAWKKQLKRRSLK